MNVTFYVPKDKEEKMREFVRLCESQKPKVNYSNLIVKWIENHLDNNTEAIKEGKKLKEL